MLRGLKAVLFAGLVLCVASKKKKASKTIQEISVDGLSQDSAQSLTTKAIKFVQAKEYQSALRLFQEALSLNPKEEGSWVNTATTQLHLGLNDDALITFTKGLRIHPDSSALKEGIAQIQGEKQSVESAAEDPGPYGRSVESKKLSKKPKKEKKNKKNKQAERFEPDDWFGPWWQQRDELLPKFRDALKNFRPLQIRNFLKPEKALALHSELYNSTSWETYESFMRWYQFHFKAIYQHQANYDDNELLSEVSKVMDNAAVKDWVRDVSVSEVNGTTLAGASYYAAGDYTMPHTDKAGGHKEKEKRRIAYILHLTKEWNPKFGGDMVWMNPQYSIHPSFNTMTFFTVSDASWHYVAPVAAITPSHIKRLAFSGWWMSNNIKQADKIEKSRNDDKRHGQFCTVVDGYKSKFLDHRIAYEASPTGSTGIWTKMIS